MLAANVDHEGFAIGHNMASLGRSVDRSIRPPAVDNAYVFRVKYDFRHGFGPFFLKKTSSVYLTINNKQTQGRQKGEGDFVFWRKFWGFWGDF